MSQNEKAGANAFLGTEPVGKLMRGYAVPCIISLLVAALYNIVDQIFIANASYLGSYGNAANTVVFPLTVGRFVRLDLLFRILQILIRFRERVGGRLGFRFQRAQFLP